MNKNVDSFELVKQAQLGCQDSMSNLTRMVEGKVCAYIYRITLDRVLAQDLSQETLLEMVKSLKRLKFDHVNQFWAWLLRTALGKTQIYFRKQQRQKSVQASAVEKDRLSRFKSSDYPEGLNNLISKELSAAIFEAMRKLKFRQRNVLVLRCFEEKSYSEIGSIMDCSEMAAQVLFFRAKCSLKRQLSRHGFGKGLLLAALGFFGQATAPVEAASETVTVTAASTKVSSLATLIGVAGSKFGAAIVTAVALASITLGGIAVTQERGGGIVADGAGSKVVISKAEFEYPNELVGAYDPGGDGWQGVEGNNKFLVPVEPGQWLVGEPSKDRTLVVLPVKHWVELKFAGKIVDGPGNDIILVEWDAAGERAGIYLTDGVGNEYLLGIARAGSSRQPSRTEIGFDISGISLPFEPCAVRIVGINIGGWTNGFDLGSVRARIQRSEVEF
jgi:RNA polymerase sigma-70 factor (ECF subfamily)